MLRDCQTKLTFGNVRPATTPLRLSLPTTRRWRHSDCHARRCWEIVEKLSRTTDCRLARRLRLDLTRQAGFIVTIYDEDGLRLAETLPCLPPNEAFAEARRIVDNRVERPRKLRVAGLARHRPHCRAAYRLQPPWRCRVSRRRLRVRVNGAIILHQRLNCK
jgi:hypothetical protein